MARSSFQSANVVVFDEGDQLIVDGGKHVRRPEAEVKPVAGSAARDGVGQWTISVALHGNRFGRSQAAGADIGEGGLPHAVRT